MKINWEEAIARYWEQQQNTSNNNQNNEQYVVDAQAGTTSSGLSRQQYAIIYDLIAEGEIEGLVNGPRSVFLNSTPLASGDSDFLYGAQGGNTSLTGNATGTTLTVSGSLPEGQEESYRQVIIEGAGKNPGSVIFTLTAGSNIVTTNSSYFSDNQEMGYDNDAGVETGNQLEFLSEDGQYFTAQITYVDSSTQAKLNDQSSISGTFSANAGTLYSNWKTAVLTDFSSNTMTLVNAVLNNVTNARLVFSSAYNKIDELSNPWNYEGASLSFFNGTLTQNYQPSSGGYSTASYLYSPNAPLKQSADFGDGVASSVFVDPELMNISNASDIDRFSLTVEGPSLISTSGNTGTEYQQPVEIQVFFRYQREGDNQLSDPALVIGRDNPDPEDPKGSGFFRAKTKKPYAFQWEFDVQPFQPFTDWEIEIKKVTSDSGQSEQYQRSRDTTLKGVQAMVLDHLNYRGTAYGIVQYSAKDFAQPPSRSYAVKGKLIKVPTNYITRDENDGFNALYTRNVTTGVNTGSEQDWNGLFRGEPGSSVANRKKVYCNNPAWVFYDIMTNPVYGLGEYIEKDLIDVYSLYQIAQYCDELVPNGEGGEEPRFTTNVIIESRQEAYKVLKDLATVFRGILYWLDGQVVAIQDSFKEPVFNFTQANVINGLFTYEGQSSRVVRNRVSVTWRNPEKGYSSEAIVVDDLESIADKNAILADNIVAFGCTSKGQAIRAGKWYLETNARENEIIKFETGSNGSFILPGDIINVQDQERSFVEFSGRISNDQANVLESPTPDANTIHLDREITLNAGSSYVLHVYFSGGAAYLAQDKDATISSTLYKTGQLISSITSKEDAADATDDSGNRIQVYWSEKGHIQSAEVDESSSSGNIIQLNSGFSQIPEPDSIWALSTDAAAVSEDLELSNFKQYRVLGIEEQEEGEYAIIASLYDATKYTIIDFGYPSSYDPSLGDPVYIPDYVPAPDELGMAFELSGGGENINEDEELVTSIATAYWTAPEEKIPSEKVDAITTLSTSLSEINNGSISVSSSAGFKSGGGVCAILTGNGTVKEFLSYEGKSAGQLTGVKRGFFSTPQYSHPSGSVVEDRAFELLPYRFINFYEVQLDTGDIFTTSGSSLIFKELEVGKTYLLKVRTVGGKNQAKSPWASRSITLIKELNTQRAVFDRVSSLGSINRLPSIDSSTGEVNIAPAAFTIENPTKDTVTVDSVVTLDYGSLVDGETAYLYYDHSETTTSPVDAFKAVEVATDNSWYASTAGAISPEVYGSASWWSPLGDASNGLENVSGTITTTLNRAKVIGSGTSFLTDFSSGDLIRFSSVNTPGTFTSDAWYSRVESVVSDTELYTVLPVTKVFTGSFAFKQSLIPQPDKDLLVSKITAEGSTEVYSIQTLILAFITSTEALEAETVNLVASSYVAQYDGDGLLEIESPDNNITLTATPGGGLGVTEGLPSDVRYRFIDGSGISPEVKQDWSTNNEYVIPELDLPAPGESLIYIVEATDASESPYSSEATDQVSIIAISKGKDAETVNLVASSYVSKYDGTGALITGSPANNITLTATPSAGLGSPIQYRFVELPSTVKQDWSTDNTYVISELDLPAVDTITTYTVEVTDGVSPYSSETSDNVTITAISDGAIGPDGRPGLPGATVLLDYDDFQGVVSSAGQYQLSTDTTNDADAGAEGNAWGNATAEAGTSPSIKAIFLHEQDSNSVDRSAELEQIQINDHITWYDSDGRWIDYSVTNILAKSGSVYGFEVNYVEHDETDGTGNIGASPSLPILIRLSRALEPITGILTNESHAEAADQDGVLLNDFNDAGGTFKVYKGVEEVNSLTPAPSFSVVSPATVDGLTMSIDSAGVYSLSGSPAEWTGDQAIFELTATYQGVSVTKIYSIVKVPEGAASVIGYLDNEIHQEPADPDGQLTDATPALSDAGGTFYVYDGLTNVTEGVEYSVVGGSMGTPSTRTIDGLELSIDSSGAYSLSENTDWTSDRVTFNLKAVYTGHTPSVTLFKNYTISKSKEGTTGINSATVYLYQRSAGLPSPSNPADGTIYTFASGNVQIGSPTNGWTTDIPEGLDPLYVIVATAASNTPADGIAANEWSEPVLFTGAGINTASVFVYQRTLTNTAPNNKPAGVTTYTFETGNISFTMDNGWTATIPDESGGLYLWVTQATAANTTSTDTIEATEWSTIRLLSQVGADGSAGVNAQAVKLESSIYAFAYNAVDGTLDTVGTPSLTATATNFEASPPVQFRFTDLSDSTVIQDWGSPSTVTDISDYIPVAEESVSIQVEAGSGGSPAEATDTITLIGLQAGAPTISLLYTNTNHTVSINNEGEYDWTGSGGLFEVFEGATPLSLGANGNNYTDHNDLENGEYQLGINTVSGNNLVEPTVNSASDSPAVYATIGEFSGNLTQNTIYRITAYIKTSLGEEITRDIDISLTRSVEARPGLPAASTLITYDNLETSLPNAAGEYGFHDGSNYTTTWSDIIDSTSSPNTIDEIRLYKVDTNSIDRSELFDQVGVGDSFTYYVSSGKWVQYEIKSFVGVTSDCYRWEVNTVQSDSTDGTGNPSEADSTTVTWRLSRAFQPSAGVDAQAVKLESDRYVIVYDNATTPAPADDSNITLTATPTNFEPSPAVQYRFTNLSDSTVVQDWDTDNTYVISSGNFPGANLFDTYQVEAGSGGSPVEASDSVTVVGVQEGSDVITVSYTNSAHTVPTESDGSSAVFGGSGGDLQVLQGSTLLNLKTNTQTPSWSGLSNGQYNLSITRTSGDSTVTEGSITGAVGTTATLQDFSSSSSKLDNLTLFNIAIYVKNLDGVELQRDIKVSLSPSEKGETTLSINYNNSAHIVPLDVSGTPSWTGSGGTLEILEGSTALTLNQASQSATYPGDAGEYNLNIVAVSGSTLTEPTISGVGGNAVLGQFSGTLSEVTTYRIDAYIKPLIGANVLLSQVITLTPSEASTESFTVEISNPGGSLPSDDSGTVSNYSGSGTDITVKSGSTSINYDNSAPYATPSFRVAAANVISGTITVGSYTNTTDTLTVGDHSSMTTDLVVIKYTITVVDSKGVETSFTKIQSISKSKQGPGGDNAYSGILTNEFGSASEGIVYGGTSIIVYGPLSNGEFKVYEGSSELTTGVTYSGDATKNGLTLAINSSTGAYTLSGTSWTTDSESFDLTANVNTPNLDITKTYTIVKTDLLRNAQLSPSDEVFKYTTGSVSPATITLSTNISAGTGSPVEYDYDSSTDGGSNWTDVQDGTNDTLTISAGDFSLGNVLYRVRVYDPNDGTRGDGAGYFAEDFQTIGRVKDGSGIVTGPSFGSGSWNISVRSNTKRAGSPADGEGELNNGEILFGAGKYVGPDGTLKTFDNEKYLFTPFEGGITPSVKGSDDNYFYIILCNTNPNTKFSTTGFGEDNATYGAANVGFFPAIYLQSTNEWKAINNNGILYAYTPDPETDNVVCLGYKSTTGSPSGIDSLTPLVAYSPEPDATVGATAGTNLYDADGNAIPEEVIENFDDATALGFNPNFQSWTGDVPTNWTEIGSGVSQNTISTYTLTGSRSVKIVGSASQDRYITNEPTDNGIDITVPEDAIVVGSIDVYVETTGTGQPGAWFDLLTDSAALGGSNAGYRGRALVDMSVTGEWQRLFFKTSKNSGDLINSPSGDYKSLKMGVGFATTGGISPGTGTIYVDNVRFAVLGSQLENESQTWDDVGGDNKPDDNATLGATAGTDLLDSSGSTLGDNDVKNSVISLDITGAELSLINAGTGVTLVPGSVSLDQVKNVDQTNASNILSGALAVGLGGTTFTNIIDFSNGVNTNALGSLSVNPTMQIQRDNSGTPTPFGYMHGNGVFVAGYEDNTTRDVMKVTANGNPITTAAIQANTGTTYVVKAYVKAIGGNYNIKLYGNQYDSDLPDGKYYIGFSTSGEVQQRTGSAVLLATTAINTSNYVIVEGEYTPTSTAEWINFQLFNDANNNDYLIKWWTVRDKSTLGATAGTDLVDSSGSTLGDDDVINRGSGINILPPRYSTFNVEVLPPAQTGQLTASISTDDKFIGESSLKLVTNSTVSNVYWFAPTTATYIFIHSESKKYLVSLWARVTSGTASLSCTIKSDSGVQNSGSAQTINTTWTRYTFSVDCSSHTQDKFGFRLTPGTASKTYYIDGILIEEKVGDNTTPSPFPATVNPLDNRVAEGIITASKDQVIQFNNDGSSLLGPRRNTAYAYSYGGGPFYNAGDTTGDDCYLTSSVFFYAGAKQIAKLDFHHIGDYGETGGSASYAANEVRSFWTDFTGDGTTSSDFTVKFGSDDNRTLAADSTFTVATEYGGDSAGYELSVTHDDSGVVSRHVINITTIGNTTAIK